MNFRRHVASKGSADVATLRAASKVGDPKEIIVDSVEPPESSVPAETTNEQDKQIEHVAICVVALPPQPFA